MSECTGDLHLPLLFLSEGKRDSLFPFIFNKTSKEQSLDGLMLLLLHQEKREEKRVMTLGHPYFCCHKK